MYPVSQAYKDAIMQPSRQFRGRLLIPKLTMNFTRNSIAYKQDGTQVAANVPRYESGKFGKAIMVEEGTTNLIVTPLIDATATNWGKVAVRGNGQANVVSGALFGDYSLEISVPNSIEDGGTDRAIWELGGTVPDDIKEAPQPNTTYTLSAWITDPTKAASIQFQPHDSDGQYHRQYGQLTGRTAIDSQGVTWYEVAVTYTTESDVTDWSWGVRVSSEFANSSGTWRACGFQLEKKPYATSFVDGTRADETLTIPTAGVLGGEFTVEFWVKPPQAGRIWGLIHSEGPGDLDGYINANGYPYFWTTNANGNRTAIWSSVPVVPNDWNYIAITIGAGVRKIHVNGQLGAQDNATPQTIGTLWLGTNPEFTYFLNGLIDDLRISNHAKTDEEILAAYREVA